MYLAQELTEGACHPDEDEFLSVERIPSPPWWSRYGRGRSRTPKPWRWMLKAKLLLGL